MAPPNSKKRTSFKASLTQEERWQLADLQEEQRSIVTQKSTPKKLTPSQKAEERFRRADLKEEKRKMEAEKKRAVQQESKTNKLAMLKARNQALKKRPAPKQAPVVPDELKTESDSEPEVQVIPPPAQGPINLDDSEPEVQENPPPVQAPVNEDDIETESESDA